MEITFIIEARVAFDEGRNEVAYFLDKITNNKKFTDNAREFINLSSVKLNLTFLFNNTKDKLEKMRLIDLSKKELKNLEIVAYETSESNKDDSGMAGVNLDVKSSWDSIDMTPNNDTSSNIQGRNSLCASKNGSEDPERKKSSILTPDDSPATKKTRKLRSKSVEKSDLTHRYKMFEKNLQKIIKNLRREKGSPVGSPSID